MQLNLGNKKSRQSILQNMRKEFGIGHGEVDIEIHVYTDTHSPRMRPMYF